jgi:sulfite exporter TauE/SafE
MVEPLVWSGFILGLAGSAHCIGMCGPLVLALPVGNQSRYQLTVNRFVYHLGRSITYALMGLMLGYIGFGFTLAGVQEYVSIIAGISMLILVFVPSVLRARFFHAAPIPFPNRIKKIMQHLMKSDQLASQALLGMLNGLLPCGFVYMGLAGAVAMGTPILSAVFMLLFGLGTLPIMLAVSLLTGIESLRLKDRLNKWFPYITAVVALLLILRGLSLGIPFLSPDLGSNPTMHGH